MAKYNYLLFLHEDVIFHTKEWGQKLVSHLEKENVGVIGIAGSNYVPRFPIGWHVPDDKYNFLYLIQNDKNSNQPKLINNIKSVQEVYALDGVFMAVKKNIYSKFYFDENLKGFHGYDLDFSLCVAQQYKNLVINDILIEHFSKGNPDLEWFKAVIYVREKINFSYNKYNKFVEKLTFQVFLNNYFKYNRISFRNIIFTFKFLSYSLSQDYFLDILKTYLYYLRLKKNG